MVGWRGRCPIGPCPIPITLLYRADIAPPPRVRADVDFLFETIGEGRGEGRTSCGSNNRPTN